MASDPDSNTDSETDPFALLSATITAIDPALLSRSPTPGSTTSTSTSTTSMSPPPPWLASPPSYPPTTISPPTSLPHSFPPRSSHALQTPRHPFPPARLRLPPRRDRPRHHPYGTAPSPHSSKRRPPAPRSVPCRPRDETAEPEPEPGVPARRSGEWARTGEAREEGIAALDFHREETTLALAMGVFVDRMAHVGMEMRAFLQRGFSASDAGDARVGLENLRLQARRKNRAVTELGEVLAWLPRLGEGEGDGSGEVEVEAERGVPRTGEEVRGLDHDSIGALLDLYDLPFVPSMFLTEKKVVWLRFVGAGRALMHRVLD